MYSKQQSSQIIREFWTAFGRYMRPLPGASGDTINWLNYKTGVRDIYFRMDVNKNEARVAVELRHTDMAEQEQAFEKFLGLKNVFNEVVPGEWEWSRFETDDDGRQVSRISSALKSINIFKTEDWPAIISFLKPRIVGLDEYWFLVKDHF